jgi:hypothetical protein
VHATLRMAFTAVVMGTIVWLLLAGQPFGAAAVAIGAIWLRSAADSGRVAPVRARRRRR